MHRANLPCPTDPGFRQSSSFNQARRGGVPCHHDGMSDNPAALPEIPPVAAVRDLARSVENGSVRLDPVAAAEFLNELTAIRDEVAIIGQDARQLSWQSPMFGTSSTATLIGQKFVDRARDFNHVIRAFHQVLADLDATAREAVRNWSDTDRAQAVRFTLGGPD